LHRTIKLIKLKMYFFEQLWWS